MNNVQSKSISIAKDFTRFPAGRFRTDGPFSGERFREEWLAPALRETNVIEVQLDGVSGYGSSFLDEAFGGLVRAHLIEPTEVEKRLKLIATDQSLVSEILGYMTP